MVPILVSKLDAGSMWIAEVVLSSLITPLDAATEVVGPVNSLGFSRLLPSLSVDLNP